MATATETATTFQLGGDMEVHRLGFGAMRITGKGIWGEPQDREECKRVLRRAVELGVDFIDTADSYGPAVSEVLIGETLAPYKRGLVIATKAGLTRQGPDKWAPVGRAEYLTQQIEMSLRHLKDRADRSMAVASHRSEDAGRGIARCGEEAAGAGKDSPHRPQRGVRTGDREGAQDRRDRQRAERVQPHHAQE